MTMKFYCNLEIKAKSRKHLEEYLNLLCDDKGIIIVKVMGRINHG